MSFLTTSLYYNVPENARMRPLPILLVKQGKDYVVATEQKKECYGGTMSLMGSLNGGCGRNNVKMDGVT
jgi:hypothetical protein